MLSLSDPLFYFRYSNGTFWISEGDLIRIAYAKFHGIRIVGYILNEFKLIFNIRQLVALPVFPDLVFKLVLHIPLIESFKKSNHAQQFFIFLVYFLFTYRI